MAAPITREAFVELLGDYVRDALQQRSLDKHSSHFALCVAGASEARARRTPAEARRHLRRLLTSFDRLHTQPAHEVKACAGLRPRWAAGADAYAFRRRPSSRRSRSTCR